ncbi:chemotaxis protein CheA [Alteromonas macleodii]|uniref:Chemotaxis protein CheA n=1 Tax=Alteromonas macleodii (strain English Channel 673) TaxID=1004788 RepID=A0AB33A1H0_ALTME|nr:chemotaxis protein CheA [Alteromonas macleodii]AFS38326.1 chemotaxis protein CheA [Alteromonas macleodii ATCC 27126]AFT75569.1 chemotaxis protein CheA [Alteromonas macleodii str. 'English Channel 673']MBL3811414.1 chemotaxis protein CheA [Alteromonas macleodii]MBL3884952.1 chemotaxis protein CheA [Alteromonas macleodii]OZB92042.1 chemotaxis protein CheA [Alteromonas macleodii]|tara:strand:- start:2759 stop:5389 length:2631 start_codon:yes stop_codon:yes gene_type:complete
MSELLDVFIGESRENLESASQELLEIQSSGPASERVDKIFRDLHTIKGSSDLFDIKPLTRLAHAAEDLLDSVRSNEVTYSDDIGDLLLEALDQISIWFDELEVGSQNVEQWKPISTQLSAQLRHFIDPTASSEVDESSATVNNESPIADPQTLSEEHIALIVNFGRNADLDLLCKATGPDCYFIQYTPDEGCFFRGEDPINVTVALPGIKAFNIEMPELGEDADIYNCFTSIKALGVAGEDEIKQHMAYYEGQYSCVSFSTQALKAACTGKIQKCVETIDDETLNSALNDTDIEQVHASAGLLLASLNFDDSEDGSANRAVLSLLSSIDDLSFLNNEIREDGCSGKDTNMNTSPEVGNSSANEAGDSKREASKPKNLALHERAMLTQQLALLNSDNYKSEFMFPSIAGLVGNILGAEFENEDALAVAISNALDEETIQAQANDDQAQQTSNDATAETTQPANTQPAKALETTEDTAAPVKAERQAVKMLKVDQSKIDYLMDIVGELTVAKNSLPYLAKQAEEEGGSRKLSKQIKAHFSIVNRLTESLQSAVLQIRMVPVSHVFQRYPRLVRDLARKLDKKIELCMQGEDTEFDKNLIESLSEPLIHLLRNSIDHGIESPAERLAAGKPEVGRIDLIATPLDDSVIIEIRDDGKGIDPQKIKLLAFQKGVISETQLENLDDNEALQLIFAAGFSTSEQVSDLSGRGVGMDAVKTMVSQAGGTIEMQSEVGVGSTFKLLLPQTMSVNRVMMFEVNDQMFGVGMDAVVETVKVPTADIQRIRNEHVLVIREKLIPLCDLREALGFEAAEEREEHSILVVSTPQGEFGLIIDKFHEGIDVIQKPLEGVLAGYAHFSGTALLGDGRVLLIINVQEVLAKCL